MIRDDLTYQEAETILQEMASAVSGGRADQATSSPTIASAKADDAQRLSKEVPSSPANVVRVWSKKTLRGLIESALDALVIVDQKGTIVFVNAQSGKLFGYRREELLGQQVELLIPEHFRKRHVEHRNRYSARPSVRPMGAGLELYGRRKDGREFPVDISLGPMETEEGTLFTSTIRDVSDRKRLEARYRTLVEGIPAVTFMAALDEGINELYISPQIEQLLGFSQKEWLEDPILWYTQLHPDDRERWHIEFARTCATGTPFRSVYRFIARDGHTVWVQGEAKVVRNNDGMPLFIQGVAFDITERQEHQEALRRAHDELEHLVQQRTAELANTNRSLQAEIAQRAETQESLSAALKEKEALLKEIHHRVKNNLQIVSSLLNLQSATIDEPHALQAFKESQNRVKSMALVHEKLYQSRDLARIDFRQYVRELGTYLFRSYGVRANEISLNFDIGDVSFTIDTAIACGLIVTELISNCLKHAFPEGRSGEVTVALNEDEKHHCTLTVRDDGVGVPSHVDPRNTESLGLQLVNILAQQLQGTFAVKSDGGTCVELRFPG